MARHSARIYSVFLFAFSFLLCATATGTATANTVNTAGTLLQRHALVDFPTVEPSYIYDQLFYVATHFQHREAGYDTNLPVSVNGHDEFATYWAQEMVHNLQGFGAQIQRDPFPVKGWQGRPTPAPAFNVEVNIPGVIHPEQVVVIGCHYDGEAISTQSANDDASGCAIELGVARAMGNYWRSHHTYSARTLRFVIFDAEEQGLYGSFHYLNSTVNGDVRNIVAMFNEEQSGIAYPLRYLGQLANPLLPLYVDMSPLQNSRLYPTQDKLSQTQIENITRFRTLMQQAVPAAFNQFQALGFQGLTYHGDNKQDVPQPIFTPEQMSNIHLGNDTLGGSDQIPFTLAGLPCATFAGNSTYYDNHPPQWSYPFDQTQDTIQLMNTFADGSSLKSNALALALALPGMLTTWMLNQPDILGQVSLDGKPVAAISDVGQTRVGRSITVDAAAAFDPNTCSGDSCSQPNFTYTWNFGDGTKASGVTVTHTYASPGSYTLTLTVGSSMGTRTMNKTLNVVTQPTTYNNPYAGSQGDGNPPHNPQVILAKPDDTLSDKVIHGIISTTSTLGPSSLPTHPMIPAGLIAAIGVLLALLVGVAVTLARRARR